MEGGHHVKVRAGPLETLQSEKHQRSQQEKPWEGPPSDFPPGLRRNWLQTEARTPACRETANQQDSPAPSSWQVGCRASRHLWGQHGAEPAASGLMQTGDSPKLRVLPQPSGLCLPFPFSCTPSPHPQSSAMETLNSPHPSVFLLPSKPPLPLWPPTVATPWPRLHQSCQQLLKSPAS